jgi:putative salt-induced outer membrane protein
MVKQFLGCALFWVSLSAQEYESGDIEDSAQGHAEFSYIDSKGNADVSSLAFEGKVELLRDLNIYRLNASVYQAQTDGVESKNKWMAEFNYDYQFDPYISLNYLVGYKVDRFSGFEYQGYTGPGLGLEFVDSDTHKLDFQGNILYSQDKPDAFVLEDYVSLKLGGIYEWKIEDNLKFSQEANYRMNLEKTQNYFIYSKSAVTVKINATVSMGVSYKIDYVNTPPPPSQRTDKTFLTSLIFDY